MPLPNEVPNDSAETRVRRWLDGEQELYVWTWQTDMRDDVRAVLGALEARIAQLERRCAGLLACEAGGARRGGVMSAPTTQARERPILFSGPMVRAILDGQKTQARRVVKPQPAESPWSQCTKCGQSAHTCACSFSTDRHADRCTRLVAAGPPDVERCPYGAIGERLWVRETFYDNLIDRSDSERASREELYYLADGDFDDHFEIVEDSPRWRSPIHMPRWACRLVLELTDVRVERLQAITEDDARAEGCPVEPAFSLGPVIEGGPEMPIHWKPLGWYQLLWDKLNAKRGHGWATNPWAWVLTFRRSEP